MAECFGLLQRNSMQWHPNAMCVTRLVVCVCVHVHMVFDPLASQIICLVPICTVQETSRKEFEALDLCHPSLPKTSPKKKKNMFGAPKETSKNSEHVKLKMYPSDMQPEGVLKKGKHCRIACIGRMTKQTQSPKTSHNQRIYPAFSCGITLWNHFYWQASQAKMLSLKLVFLWAWTPAALDGLHSSHVLQLHMLLINTNLPCKILKIVTILRLLQGLDSVVYLYCATKKKTCVHKFLIATNSQTDTQNGLSWPTVGIGGAFPPCDVLGRLGVQQPLTLSTWSEPAMANRGNSS